MKKILVVLFLFFANSLFAKVVYVPCEGSIAGANVQLETKIKATTGEINLKTSKLKRKYDEYLKKLKEYNERLQGYQYLQSQKNLLLLDVKNELSVIKTELYLGETND
jgi:hypothetical protein